MTDFNKEEFKKRTIVLANKCIKNALEKAYWEDEIIIASELPVSKGYMEMVIETIKGTVTVILYDLDKGKF